MWCFGGVYKGDSDQLKYLVSSRCNLPNGKYASANSTLGLARWKKGVPLSDGSDGGKDIAVNITRHLRVLAGSGQGEMV